MLGAASGKALELIDSTRQGTRNGTRFKDSTVEGAMGHVTTYRDGSAEYGIDINNLGIDRVRSRLADQGFEAPPMLVVLVLLHTAGHEAGHMIQRGISQTGLTRAEGVSSFDSFSDLVLRNCPDARLTLDPQENVAIHNERFAEGYANITLRAAVESLGYDGDYADAVVRAIAIDEVSPTMKEHIAKTTTETTVAQSYEQAGLSPEYLGMLGYTRPLTLDQIVADLEFANNKATLIADKRLGINSTDGYDETLIDIARAYKVMPSDRIEKSSREVTAHKGMRVGRRIMLAISHFLNAKPISVKK
ncbi:MAG: hypothetical protein WBB94_02715 [Candidatus Saccharimonadaceae bacterium]